MDKEPIAKPLTLKHLVVTLIAAVALSFSISFVIEEPQKENLRELQTITESLAESQKQNDKIVKEISAAERFLSANLNQHRVENEREHTFQSCVLMRIPGFVTPEEVLECLNKAQEAKPPPPQEFPDPRISRGEAPRRGPTASPG